MRPIAGWMIAALAVPLAGGTAQAAEVTSRPLASRVTTVALFKNGLAFVTRETDLPRGETRFALDGLPAPVHGTFWAWSPGRPDEIRRLVASLEPSSAPGAALSLGEYTLANVGRDVEVTFGDGKVVRGKVLEPATPPLEGPIDASRILPGQAPIRIATSDGIVAFDASSIARVAVRGDPPHVEVNRRVPKSRLQLETQGGDAAKLSLVYLSRGATWAPSYAVDLIGKDKARVTAKAEIVNELEDWSGIEVKLVTGYPNIAYNSVDDPMAMRGDLAAFLAALGNAGPGVAAGYAGAMRQNIAYDRFEGREEAPAYSTQVPAGEHLDELFLYPLPRFSLARGQRAYVPLFSVDAAAEHLYELSLDDRIHDDRFEVRPGQPQPPLEIWHRVRLTNSGTVPWTTAPAMATRGGALVAQDELPYAAPGGTSTLRITRVSDLRADADEFEIERKPRALEVYGHVYDEITVRGIAEVASLRDEDVTITVTKSLTGQVLASTPAAKVDRTTQKLLAVNPSSTIRWSLPLKAHAKLKLEYRYKVLIQV